MPNKRFPLFPAVIIVALCILGLARCYPYWWVPLPTPAVHRTPLIISGLSEIWSLPNIYAEQAYYMPKMVASAGKVMLVGRMSNNEEDRLICLDGSSGKVAWERDLEHKERGRLSVIYSAPLGLFSGRTGVPSVMKLDLSTGDELWSQSLPGRGLLYIFVNGGEVQIVTTLEWFTRLNADNGKVIEKINGRGILFSTSQITFSPILSNNLQAEDTTTGKLIWRVSLDRQLRMAPLFTDDIIYLRSGETMGSVYAVQRSTGNILWKIDNIVISNIAVSPAKKLAYVLTREGKLLGIDTDSGVSTTLIEFSNGPFTLNGEDIVGGYELAYDRTTGSLFILLGDSRQLFAFKEDE
jgi:outer membrane protein assembly factor BamB